MLKKTSFILVLVGMLIVSYAGLQLWTFQQSEKEALAHAKTILQKRNSEKTQDHDMDNQLPLPHEASFHNGESIGVLEIPGINKELPIVEGTDEDALKQGVGHYTKTVYPGQKNQILLSGHRDTAFTGLDKLNRGDKIIVKMHHGSFTYSIVDSEIVEADDTTVIRSTAPDELLTLSTCYPFRYIGHAPQRYIVYAKPE